MTTTPDTMRLQALADDDHADDWDQMEDVSDEFANIRPRKDRQLNLRVDEDLLDTLRDAAARRGLGYHSLARQLIEEGLARATYEQAAPVPSTAGAATGRPFRIKEVMLVLLGATGADGRENEAIEGMTRLQKLLFLTAQHLQPHVAARFEAYDYGPFEESVSPDLEFLADEGLVEMSGRLAAGPPESASDPARGAALLEWVRSRHATEPGNARVESYRLTQLGMKWVQRFVASSGGGSPEALAALQRECAELKARFGRVPLTELVDYVYSQYPEFTEHSRIRHEVAERRARSRREQDR